MKKTTVKLRDVRDYLQGNLRSKFYFSKYFKFLLRKHVREQIEYRINSTDEDCKEMGVCKMCGCKVPALQMADKECDNKCYPKMIDSNHWWLLKIKARYNVDFISLRDYKWNLDLNNKKFKYERESF